jgi:murein DD-endopeptidase MepM/ murein hydrolase activator NlpD
MMGMARWARPFAVMATVASVFGLLGPVPASADVTAAGSAQDLEGCYHPDEPRRFHRHVVKAIEISRDLPRAWAHSRALARIACWQGAGFDTDYREQGRAYYVWRGMFAMTVEEVETIFGRWMTAERGAFELSKKCFKHGWDACPHATANSAWAQQIIAASRWIWLNYGTPTAALAHIKRTGRFNSYPRPGTHDEQTRDPFRRCPVAGQISYRDSFGERRTVGGYHPHWGNDIIAPAGRSIRAPFDGLAVAHRDGWFAGLYVTVVGNRGYVRNVHLSRVAELGVVEAGDVIGYVGETGDARGPHDHFEWHPWSVPVPRHRSPYGFDLVMDAIDPYPFLNKACGAQRVPVPRRLVDTPLEP